MKIYIPRLIEKTIEKQLKVTGCIVIEGPKWCGKSTTAQNYAKTIIRLQNPIIYKKYDLFSHTDGTKLLEGELPILFDEWQKIPDIWDFIREDIDINGGRGKYILTGSAKPIEDKNRHTGTGRIAKILMRPMSLFESSESNGQVSLNDLFNGDHNISGDSKLSIDDIARVICRGGWPESIAETENFSSMMMKNYYNSLTDNDIVDVDGIKRNSTRAKAIVRAYARHISSQASNATIIKDVRNNENALDEKTFNSYTNAFRKLFVIEDVIAWSPKLRSRTTIQTSNKRQFIDPSIAVMALGANANSIIDDIETMGLLFESLCIRDLRIYSEVIGGTIYHYHDKTGLEVDAIIHLENGDWGAVEIKLGGNKIDEAAKNLLKFKEKIDIDEMRAPKFLMILTGLSYSYRRPDGIIVVSIGNLRD